VRVVYRHEEVIAKAHPIGRRLLGCALLFAPGLTAPESPAALASRGRWKELRAIVEPRVHLNPNDAEAEWLLSRARIAFHDVDGALAAAEKAVALAPRNADYLWQLAQVYGEEAQRAGVLHQLGFARKFRHEAEAALAVDPNLDAALMGLMEYYERAPAIAGGDKQKAEDMANRLAAISTASGLLARIRLLRLRKPTPATTEIVRLYEQLIRADPRRYEPHIELSNIYASETPARLGRAEQEAAAARAIDPERIDAYRLLAGIHAASGRWSNLETDLADADTRVPGDVSPWLAAATALLGTGKDLERAERYARKYLTVEPEPDEPTPAFAHWQLGLILEKERRVSDAIAELETALRLDPKLDSARGDLKRLRS
jgi:tetratricopeptide (TPR) repeat protein